MDVLKGPSDGSRSMTFQRHVDQQPSDRRQITSPIELNMHDGAIVVLARDILLRAMQGEREETDEKT